MSERPILFSDPMVRAILEGRKTQTRRMVTKQNSIIGTPGVKWEDLDWTDAWPDIWHWRVGFDRAGERLYTSVYPRVKRGDVLWVREGFFQECHYPFTLPCGDPGPRRMNWGFQMRYVADGIPEGKPGPSSYWHKRPSIHMPRKRSRLSLPVTGVRAEWLQDISEEDARAEGALYHYGREIGHSGWRHDINHDVVYPSAKMSFSALWDSINGKTYPWASNPPVWTYKWENAQCKTN